MMTIFMGALAADYDNLVANHLTGFVVVRAHGATYVYTHAAAESL